MIGGPAEAENDPFPFPGLVGTARGEAMLIQTPERQRPTRGVGDKFIFAHTIFLQVRGHVESRRDARDVEPPKGLERIEKPLLTLPVHTTHSRNVAIQSAAVDELRQRGLIEIRYTPSASFHGSNGVDKLAG